MIQLDLRGLSCPQPVLELKNALEENDKEVYKLLVNEAHTVQNLTKFAMSQGRGVQVKQENSEYELIVE